MSYTTYADSFEFCIDGSPTAEQLIEQHVNELSADPEVVAALNYDDSCFENTEDFVDEAGSDLQAYIRDGEDGALLVVLDTEDRNYSCDVFNALVRYFARRQSGEYGVHNWSCVDSREGVSSGVNRIYRDGTSVAVTGEPDQAEDLLNLIADALWGEDADQNWSADTLDAIADAILSQRPDLAQRRGVEVALVESARGLDS